MLISFASFATLLCSIVLAGNNLSYWFTSATVGYWWILKNEKGGKWCFFLFHIFLSRAPFNRSSTHMAEALPQPSFQSITPFSSLRTLSAQNPLGSSTCLLTLASWFQYWLESPSSYAKSLLYPKSHSRGVFLTSFLFNFWDCFYC